jgi:hypothetical protein
MDTVDNPLKHAAGLSAVWQKCMSEVYGPECRLLIGREHGQLKRLKESLGGERSTQIIQYAIQNWGTFAGKATQNAGTELFPNKPHVGFLLKYHATALILMLDEKKKAAVEQATKEAQGKEAAIGMQELKSKKSSPALLCLTKEQLDAYFDFLENLANEAWVDSVTEEYGEWRPANPGEKGVPCDIELKKAG